MFILLQHLGLPTGAAIVISIIVIKITKAGLSRGPFPGRGARDRHDHQPRR